MVSELTPEKWKQLPTAKTGLTLPLSVGEQLASYQSLCEGDLFHQNTNFFSKVNDDIVKRRWGNNKKIFQRSLSRLEVKTPLRNSPKLGQIRFQVKIHKGLLRG